MPGPRKGGIKLPPDFPHSGPNRLDKMGYRYHRGQLKKPVAQDDLLPEANSEPPPPPTVTWDDLNRKRAARRAGTK